MVLFKQHTFLTTEFTFSFFTRSFLPQPAKCLLELGVEPRRPRHRRLRHHSECKTLITIITLLGRFNSL